MHSALSPRSHSALRFHLLALLLPVLVLGGVLLPSSAQAQNLIRQPGAHNQYQLEVEPQLGVRWNSHWYGGDSSGVGPGVRVNFPLMHNGPIDTINNNIAISVGLNTYFFNHDVVNFSVPVAFQWNFYFTDIISVFGEAGLVHDFYTRSNWSSFRFDPLFQGGGRFQFGKVGVVVRMGYPGASVGCNIQF